MRWFKHFSDNHRGQGIQALFDKFGHMGPCCYWILVEMCAEKLEKPPNKKLDDSHLLFNFSQGLVRRNLRISSTKVEHLLEFCQTKDLIRYKIFPETFQIYMPILLDLLDRDLKKPRSERAQAALKARSELELESDVELELELELQKQKPARKIKSPIQIADAQKTKSFIAGYCEHFKRKYGFNPDIRGKESGIAKRLCQDVGEEKLAGYLTAFFSMPDSWLHKTKHPLSAFETKLNEIAAFANSGEFTTNTQANQHDQLAGNMALLHKIRKQGS